MWNLETALIIEAIENWKLEPGTWDLEQENNSTWNLETALIIEEMWTWNPKP